jgi:hypothetical protein
MAKRQVGPKSDRTVRPLSIRMNEAKRVVEKLEAQQQIKELKQKLRSMRRVR